MYIYGGIKAQTFQDLYSACHFGETGRKGKEREREWRFATRIARFSLNSIVPTRRGFCLPERRGNRGKERRVSSEGATRQAPRRYSQTQVWNILGIHSIRSMDDIAQREKPTRLECWYWCVDSACIAGAATFSGGVSTLAQER